MTPCDLVTERLALGEPLGDVEEHIATCPACSRLIALPRLVAAAAHAAEPNPGFVIRSSAGARALLVTRRRNRIITHTLGAIAAVMLGVWALKTPVAQPEQVLQGMRTAPAPLEPVGDDEPALDDLTLTDDQIAAELVLISDHESVMAPSPHWAKVEAPLARYRQLVKEGALR